MKISWRQTATFARHQGLGCRSETSRSWTNGDLYPIQWVTKRAVAGVASPVRRSIDRSVAPSLTVNKAEQQGHLPTGFGSLWVLTGDGSTLAALDPDTGVITAEVGLDARGLDVAVDSTSVWVISALDDVLVRIDPLTMTVTDRVEANEPIALAFPEGAVWVGEAGAVVRLDAGHSRRWQRRRRCRPGRRNRRR